MKYNLELNRANIILGSGEEITNAIWGAIKGDITEQKDLQQELTDIKESIPDLTQVKEDIASLESDITGLVTKQELTTGLADKADTSSLNSLIQEVGLKVNKTDLSEYSTTIENDVKYQPKGNYLTTIPPEYVTDSKLDSKGYVTDISGKADISSVYTKSEVDLKLGNIDTILDFINGEVI